MAPHWKELAETVGVENVNEVSDYVRTIDGASLVDFLHYSSTLYVRNSVFDQPNTVCVYVCVSMCVCVCVCVCVCLGKQ